MRKQAGRFSSLKSVLLLVLVVPLLLVGCKTAFQRRALEGDSNLAVIAEGSLVQMIRPMLEHTLEREILTPQPEKRFYLYWGNEDSLSLRTRWQNVLLVGTLDSEDRVSRRLQNMLSAEAKRGVEEGRYTIFRRQDEWCANQTVVFLVAPDVESLLHYLGDNGEELFSIFHNDRYDRMEREIYSRYEQTDLADSLRRAHGWTMRIQHDYTIVASRRSPDHIRFRRSLPDRFLTVAWRIGDPDEVTVDNLFAWRNQLGALMADSTRINPAWYLAEETTIAGYPALKVHGLWETYSSLGGGPFVSYLLHAGGTLYLLDGQVFAPDRDKEPFIRQFEVILNTFVPPGD